MSMVIKGNKVRFKHVEVDEVRQKEIVSQFNLLYLLIEVLNTAAFDLSEVIKGTKYDLRQDQKILFKTLVSSSNRLRTAVLEGYSDETKLQYGDTADKIYYFTKMLLSRCYQMDDRWAKAYYMILESMPKAVEVDTSTCDEYFDKTWEE